jgi:predicted lipoprotein with Yx(FWY)xxD motif
MTHSKLTKYLGGATAIPLTVLAIGACGSSNGSAVVHPTTANGQAATVGVASQGNLGKILVDSQGRTVYLFKKDSGTKSTCSGACATAWPPLRTSAKPTVGSGASASKISTTARSDGMSQVTYNGHPLYRFGGDRKAGQANGQGLNAFGASWFVVSPAGNQITGNAASSGSTGSSGGY